MAFTGISPQASVFGTETSEGILVAKTDTESAPGGFVFSTKDGSSTLFFFVWVDAGGALRIYNCTAGTGTLAIYNPGTNQMTFAAFDQNTSGTVVGTQT